MLAPLAALALAACSDMNNDPAAPLAPRTPTLDESAAEHQSDVGAVYVETNGATANAVLAFRRAADGALSPLGAFATGGRGIGGTNDPLTSQFAVALSQGHDVLLAVNAGSNEVSSFRVNANGSLTLASAASSGGVRPVSIAIHDRTAFVLNAGDNTLQGFRIVDGARLVPLPGTKTSLATGASGGAAVRFTQNGRALVVSERVSNRLEVFRVLRDGTLGAPTVTASNGSAAFGFDISARGSIIVSETQGSLTSYALGRGGLLDVVTPSISTDGSAPCWVTITNDGRFAYTTNSASSAVAGFAVEGSGQLRALTPGQPTGFDGAGAIPLDLDHVGNHFLYTLESGGGSIGVFRIHPDGTLSTPTHTSAGTPASGFQGLAAF